MNEPVFRRYMRRQACAFELGISRHTLSTIIKTDATFPRFVKISPGVEVIAKADFDRWLRGKRLSSLTQTK